MALSEAASTTPFFFACAAKCKAEIVYTWNLKHYQSLAPAVASRIKTT